MVILKMGVDTNTIWNNSGREGDKKAGLWQELCQEICGIYRTFLSVGNQWCAAKNYGRSVVSVPSCVTLHLKLKEMCSALLLMRQTFLWTMSRRLFPPPFSLKNSNEVLGAFQFFLWFSTTSLAFLPSLSALWKYHTWLSLTQNPNCWGGPIS